MDLYKQMGEELRSLFKDLFHPHQQSEAREKMAKIIDTAKEIGGSIFEEAKELSADVINFLKKPTDPKLLAVLKKHALRLEQETREL